MEKTNNLSFEKDVIIEEIGKTRAAMWGDVEVGDIITFSVCILNQGKFKSKNKISVKAFNHRTNSEWYTDPSVLSRINIKWRELL